MSSLVILLLSLCAVSNIHYIKKLHGAHHNFTFPNRPFLASSLNTIVINLSQLRKSTSSLSNCSSGSSKLPPLYLTLLLLSTSKYIELNPGPVKYPCQICNKAVKWTTPGVCCDSCDGWYHESCMGMNSAVYSGLENVSWYCCKSGLPNFSTTLFDTMFLDDSNQFSPLSTTPQSPEIQEIDIGSPSASSSPKHQTKSQRAKKNGRNDIPLKVTVVNLRSIAKQKPELLILLEATQADVIIGTESWLTDSISDSKICLPGYTMFRKDRASGIGGGVFLMISSEFAQTLVFHALKKWRWYGLKYKSQDANQLTSVLFFGRPITLTQPTSMP